MLLDLSIIIPSLNEKYLGKTIEDILEHSKGNTEIIAVLDGWKPDYELPQDKRVKYIYLDKSIGQRASTNLGVRQSNSRYVAKCDAHCSFSQGFDIQMIKDMQKNMVMTPMLCLLDAEQWQIIPKPFTKKYYFDTNMEFKYGKKEDEDEWGLVETMSLQGSCFMVERENYWRWDLCDQTLGSWGGQGTEVAIKTFLNGGRIVTNTNVFYGHLFRGEGQEVKEIPYERKSKDAKMVYDKLKKQFLNKSIAPLIKKFNYPADWTPEIVESLPD